MSYHRRHEEGCDKCGQPIKGGHCPCCGVLGRNGLRTTVCDCGSAWSEYVRKLVADLRRQLKVLSPL
jgi:hypothetical protein